ncbi:MAG: Asp-tRNA(Asn)/Glu-tRNA(Gln) amidotransferase subunit GatB [Dehalococcoidia bacterium]|nr:Asp-tRNA(Asn)/Glu-tRNA(Gln) amidotransferase subunit GatB [Dehalococcoidia bacterium]
MTSTSATKYETVIGLEVHVQLQTRRKMFCGCSADYADAVPNTHVCPVCMALPGVLPVINEKAVESTVMTALALNCSIPAYSKFDRKNYPYPDLLKGYQISQYDLPLSERGWLEVEVEEQPPRRIGITRVHLEEDTARLTHKTDEAGESYSLLDLNRSGVPLMEIVGEPDLRSPEEARAYLVKLRQILRYIGVSKANMEEGNFRCDANISLRPRGATAYGARVEVKNMNSFRAVENALRFEAERQTRALDAGASITQETRGWVEGEGTVSQRSKEGADDYRYFPEPDLPPVTLTAAQVEAIRAPLPELPDARRRRFEQEFGLPAYEANLLTESRARAEYFERVIAAGAGSGDASRRKRARAAANWMIGDFARLLHASGLEIDDARISPADLCAMIALVEDGAISGTSAKAVFEEMFQSGRAPAAVVRELGLEQISGSDEIAAIVDRVLAANEKPVAEYRAGKQEALKFLVGQAMRESRGRLNAAALTETLTAKLREKA